MKLDVYAFGNALMDIQVHISDSLLDKLDVEKGNMYLTERDRQEEILKELMDSDKLEIDRLGGKLQTSAGGSAANSIFGVVQLGGQAGLCGKVAKDGFGDLYIKDMQDHGVYCNENQADGMTGTSVILISDDAQRTMLTCLGVASQIRYSDVNEEMLKDSKYIYLEGYLFDSPVATETFLQVVEVAKKNDVKISLSASDPFCVDRHKDIFLKLIQNDVDLLFANAQEAQALAGTDDTAEAVKMLSKMCDNVAVTDGEQGSFLNFRGEALYIEPHKVNALDTTGAGDSYAAGLLYGLTSGYSLPESGKLASFYASRIVAQVGPRYLGDIKKDLRQM